MNTEDLKRLTVLLVPPAGDTALLAEETAGGRVPIATGPGWRGAEDGYAEPGWTFGTGNANAGAVRGLVLVRNGAPVRLGIFRAWDMADDLSSDDLGAALTMEPAEIAEWVAALRRNNEPIGRVVLLRDGREVASRGSGE